MIQDYSYLTVVDNTGALKARCIRVLNKKKNRTGSVGDLVSCSIKEAVPNKKVKKGEVKRGILLTNTFGVLRKNGVRIQCSSNNIALLNEQGQLLGNRFRGPVYRELRRCKLVKILSLSKNLI